MAVGCGSQAQFLAVVESLTGQDGGYNGDSAGHGRKQTRFLLVATGGQNCLYSIGGGRKKRAGYHGAANLFKKDRLID